ncbi:hypothetical protein [Falsirhodobacter sp. alg1]|uniref:hypothetical protein n=1 Tax=Falsirhodobacter sp. alg1 TaxID=1472418 RepID=UPI0005EF3A06|nr:hypothetical protein [Falsirhodobacter sp. alg1]
MRTMPYPAAFLALAALPLMLLPETASAYVGPGAGMTAIGTILALVSALFLAIVGFVWYPIKRMLKRKPSAETNKDRN